jgi:hypothetical protein
MQTLVFLSFELQIAQQRLRETFTESPVPSKALHSNSLSLLTTTRKTKRRDLIIWSGFVSTKTVGEGRGGE